ncbi:hypothetical protein A2U01_0056243, partial [Trifolium medium]|nr:hypothetical protein [Trifolium medium]
MAVVEEAYLFAIEAQVWCRGYKKEGKKAFGRFLSLSFAAAVVFSLQVFAFNIQQASPCVLFKVQIFTPSK